MKSPVARSLSGVASEFERRAARAETLARIAGAPRDPLEFAAGLFRAQARVAAALEDLHADDPLSGRLAEDAERLGAQAAVVLRYAAECGPPGLAADALSRREDTASTARTRMLVWWEGGPPAREDYLSRAMLRPYVAVLRTLGIAPDRIHRRGACPYCAGAPSAAARREGSLMEGAKRMLVCALCGDEWSFGRILCPCCLEENPERLPSFSASAHPTVRIEACETCRRYVKSIDLSEDARPIPEVDDLLSLSMDLWAREQGFERIEPGIAGL